MYVVQSGQTPLACASQFGSNQTVQRLVACGAAVDARDNDGSTALHYAAENGHADVVNGLLDLGARGDFLNQDGLTPLDLARYAGHAAIADVLDKTVARAPIRECCSVWESLRVCALQDRRVLGLTG